MKFIERLTAALLALALWIALAFVLGAIARPLYEVFMYGFHVWS